MTKGMQLSCMTQFVCMQLAGIEYSKTQQQALQIIFYYIYSVFPLHI